MGQKTYNFELAETQAEWAKGLSGREQLPAGQALIFEFNEARAHCMWMKDMQFAIDIIWLSADKQVQHIEENVSPSTYPQSFCDPAATSEYVIELAAGQVQASGVRVGDTVSF